MKNLNLPVYDESDPPPECPHCGKELGVFMRTNHKFSSEYPDWVAYRCPPCGVGVVRLEERVHGPHP